MSKKKINLESLRDKFEKEARYFKSEVYGDYYVIGGLISNDTQELWEKYLKTKSHLLEETNNL